MQNNVWHAVEFATKAHANPKPGASAVRKYTGEPYVCHVMRVAKMVDFLGIEYDGVIAALLHDTVEDCHVSFEDIHREFGEIVASYVAALTKPELIVGNRAKRKEVYRAQLKAHFSSIPRIIKIADTIDNIPSIVENDKNFAKRFMDEAQQLYDEVLKGECAVLERELVKLLNNYKVTV